ncbi:hypothetical protein MLD38_030855 [Melastoma candidum]|uniref:Uncharacterized protein n=1 Tax=Melastoma candidum TaxID=119954 RepID=A0ACB9MNG2_9MYRT|nr:hypothetical protein MLD38_030855 [Melastoma candidum]
MSFKMKMRWRLLTQIGCTSTEDPVGLCCIRGTLTRCFAVVPQGGNTGLVGGSVPVYDKDYQQLVSLWPV